MLINKFIEKLKAAKINSCSWVFKISFEVDNLYQYVIYTEFFTSFQSVLTFSET